MERLAQALEDPSSQVALLDWQGDPSQLVDQLAHLSPEAAVELAQKSDAGLQSLDDLEKLSGPDLVAAAVEMLQ